MENSKKINFYKRHLQFICGFDSDSINNLTDDEIIKLYLKHS